MVTKTGMRAGGPLLRLLVAFMGTAGLLGWIGEARAKAALERRTLEARVAAVRQAVKAADTGDDSGDLVAQWRNWGNYYSR